MLSDNQELREKLARRVAVLVASDYKNKQDTYEKMKGFYSTRNKIFHGSGILPITEDALKELLNYAKFSMRNYVLLLDKYHDTNEIKSALDKFFDSEKLVEIDKAILSHLSPK